MTWNLTFVTSTFLTSIFLNKNDIENILYQIPKPFIMSGDFNSYSTEWDSIKTDNRGKEIEKMLENDHLVLFNNLEPT